MSLLPMKRFTHIFISRFDGTYGFFARYIYIYHYILKDKKLGHCFVYIVFLGKLGIFQYEALNSSYQKEKSQILKLVFLAFYFI